MTENQFGKIITGPQQRDAVHVAVAPVIAAATLKPGMHVGFIFIDGTESVSWKSTIKIGVVDPFLTQDVLPGEQFWLFLYPNTVTSLRHAWTHPAFPTTEPIPTQRAESETWLRIYAARLNSYDAPEVAFARLMAGLQSGEIVVHGTETYHLGDLDQSDELKAHAETYLGRSIRRWDDFTFRCSC